MSILLLLAALTLLSPHAPGAPEPGAKGAAPQSQAAAEPGAKSAAPQSQAAAEPDARHAAPQSLAAAGHSAKCAAVSGPTAPGPDARRAAPLRPPNELGKVLILEYHRLGEPESLWYRSEAGFRRDLEALYVRGYRPITVRQLVRGEIDLPAGLSPVVVVMDDSSLGQFYYLDSGRRIDPHTMVGIWEAFRAAHPDWTGGATWCVLPGAKAPSNFWAEPERVSKAEREARIRDKLRFLIDRGHEICNHTLWHAPLSKYDDAFVQAQIAEGEAGIRAFAPDYAITTFALPQGLWPKHRALAWEGCSGKTCYRYEAVLEVSGGPAPSPFAKGFDQHRLTRTIAAPGALEEALDRFDAHPEERYVSDGDPKAVSFPRAMADRVDSSRLGGRVARPCDPLRP
jgi:hypothetical protein